MKLLLKTCYDAIKPYFVYVPLVSSISGLFTLFKNEIVETKTLKDRSIVVVNPHEKARVAISIIPVIGNVIVAIVDIAEKLFTQDIEKHETPEKLLALESKTDYDKEAFEKLREEKEAEIENLKAQLKEQEARLSETNEQLISLRHRISSDKNPDIIITLATKNKELNEEIKAKRSELEEKETQFKKLEAEKIGAGKELIVAEQTIEKLKKEIEAKNAVSNLHLSNDYSEIQSMLNEIEDKIDLFKKLLVPNRKSYLPEILYLQKLVVNAVTALGREKNKTSEQTDKYKALTQLSADLENAKMDEQIIDTGNDAVECLIRSLDPDYVSYSSEQLLELKKWMYHDEQPFRMKMLLTALKEPS